MVSHWKASIHIEHIDDGQGIKGDENAPRNDISSQCKLSNLSTTNPQIAPILTMRCSSLALPITALLASSAHGAECYAQAGGPGCVTNSEIYNARQDYCGNNLWQQCGSKVCFISR